MPWSSVLFMFGSKSGQVTPLRPGVPLPKARRGPFSAPFSCVPLTLPTWQTEGGIPCLPYLITQGFEGGNAMKTSKSITSILVIVGLGQWLLPCFLDLLPQQP